MHASYHSKNSIRTTYNEWDLLEALTSKTNHYCHISTYIRRNSFKKVVPPKMEENKGFNGDVILAYAYLEYGKVKYFDEVMSIYRINNGGVWSIKTEKERFRTLLADLYVFEYTILIIDIIKK